MKQLRTFLKGTQYTIAASLAFSIILASQNANADDIEKGKTVYNGSGACATCHGPQGLGDGAASAALNPKPANFQIGNYRIDTNGDGKAGTEEDLFNIITNGAQKYGGSMMMVGRSDIPEGDRKALIKFVLSLKK
jgi:mono/diheme cytochrome c family protein